MEYDERVMELADMDYSDAAAVSAKLDLQADEIDRARAQLREREGELARARRAGDSIAAAQVDELIGVLDRVRGLGDALADVLDDNVDLDSTFNPPTATEIRRRIDAWRDHR